MGARSEAGNKYLLVEVDRTSKFLFAYPLPSNTVANVAKKLLEVLLTFGIPFSLRSDPGTEFTAEFVQHLWKWLNVTVDYGPSDHPRDKGAVRRLRRWVHDTLVKICKKWPWRWDKYVQPALWLHLTTPGPNLPGKPTPFLLLFGRGCRTQMDATHQAPTTRAWKDYIITLLTRAKPFAKCRKSEKVRSIAMGSDGSDESTRTLGSDAALPGPK